MFTYNNVKSCKKISMICMKKEQKVALLNIIPKFPTKIRLILTSRLALCQQYFKDLVHLFINFVLFCLVGFPQTLDTLKDPSIV